MNKKIMFHTESTIYNLYLLLGHGREEDDDVAYGNLPGDVILNDRTSNNEHGTSLKIINFKIISTPF